MPVFVLCGTDVLFPHEPLCRQCPARRQKSQGESGIVQSPFVGGLIPGGNTTMTASEYVDDADSFVVQTSTGFLNGLVGGVTAGIYTPTQTKFYLPVEELNKTAAAGRESAKEEE